MKPNLSIVMAVGGTFENGRLIKTVESVLEQTFENFELLIVDDTKDNSVSSILEQHVGRDHRVVLFINGDNIGLTKSLNHGIKHARGKYIARIDAEDSWEKTKLSKQVNFLDKNPDYVICGTDGNFINPKGEIISGFKSLISDAQLRRRILTRSRAFLHPSIMFKNIGISYRDFFYYSQDLDLYMRLMFQGKMHCIPEKLTFCMVPAIGISLGKGYYFQRKYQNICYKLLKERIKCGYDSLDQGKNIQIKQSQIGIYCSQLSSVFFRKYLNYYNSNKMLSRIYRIISLVVYMPALFDFLNRLIAIVFYKNIQISGQSLGCDSISSGSRLR